MKVFSYKGVNEKGKEVKGVVEANSRAGAIALLKSKRIFPYEISEIETKKKEFFLLSIGKTFSDKELAVFFRTLSSLLEAGIPLVEALESFLNETKEEKKKAFISKVIMSLKEGKSFSESLKFSKLKDPIVLALVASGEKGGFLAQNLSTIADILEKREEIRSSLAGALIYPLILITVSVGVIIFMMAVVVPKIVSIYDSMKLSLPTPTKIILSISSFFRDNAILLIFLILMLSFSLPVLIKRKRKLVDKIKLRIPILGELLLYTELLYFFETLGNLLKSGVPLGEAVDFSINTLGNKNLQEKFWEVKEDIERGEKFTEALLKKVENIPFVVVQLIKAGEKSGNLSSMFLKSSNFLKKEIEIKIKNLTSLFESITMIAVGSIIGFIIISLLLPIVEISTVKKF
jgi:type II secretory pathway component PulF